MARPIATRCCCPPESSRGFRSSSFSRPRISDVFATFASISSFGRPAIFKPKATLSRTEMCGKSAYDWNTIAISRSEGCTSVTSRPAMPTVPSLMVSRPEIIRRSVDFPQPDGPTKTTNSPSLISSEISLITSTEPKLFLTFWSSTCPIFCSFS